MDWEMEAEVGVLAHEGVGARGPRARASPPSELAERFEQLLKAASQEVFDRRWLELACDMLPGPRSALLLAQDSPASPFVPTATWPPGTTPDSQLGALAERALERGPVLVGPSRVGGDEIAFIALPFGVGAARRGVVALALGVESQSEAAEALARLRWGRGWLEVPSIAGSGTSDQQSLERLLELIAVPLEQPDFRAAAAAFATELATLFEADRVSLGFVQRGFVKLRAVSHAAQFERRVNLLRRVEMAMTEALDQECCIQWPTPSQEGSQVTRAHELLAIESDLGSILSVPLARGGSFVGVLTLERSAERPFEASERLLIETAADFAAPILEGQRLEDRWIWAKIGSAVRRESLKLFGPQHLGLKLAATGVLVLLAFLVLARGDYRVTADATLEAEVLRAAVAPFEGYVEEAHARAGDRVSAGDLLARLDDRELRLEKVRWQSELEALQKQARQHLADRDTAQVRITRARLRQARAQLSLVEAELEKTSVIAPFDGIVVSGDLSQALGAPVRQGEVLFEVAPLEGYRIALAVDERDIEALQVGQRGHLAFAAFPGDKMSFEVETITPVSTAREGRNTFRVDARLDVRPPRAQPGLEGVGKVEVGRRPLLWIWTHEAVDWLRLLLWKWLP